MTKATSSAFKRITSKETVTARRRSTGSLEKSCLAQVRKLKVTQSNRSSQPFPFMRLPSELRNMIYRLALQHPKPIEVRAKCYYAFRRQAREAKVAPGSKLTINLLQASHQVNTEATSILYGSNTFHITGSYSGGCAAIFLDFLTDVGRSVKYLRRIELGHIYNMKTTISALHLLKKAKNFEKIKFDYFDCLQHGSKYNKVAMLLPWLRSLYDARLKAGKSFSVQSVLEIEIDANLKKSYFESEAAFEDRRILTKTWYDEQMGMLEMAL